MPRVRAEVYCGVPIIPLYGHAALRRRLAGPIAGGSLPASLLLHGPAGVGKQRLALWIGQALLCSGPGERPCGECQACRYALELAHPDLHWYFPRPRLKEAEADAEEVRADYADAAAERVKAGGLYAPPSGSEGLFVATVRAIVREAALSPALARRKVFVIGDAERMVPQEGSEQAANAFLKLLEEPPDDTTIIITSSEPGALLPTIRSRVVSVRVPPLSEEEVREFLADPVVAAALAKDKGMPADEAARLRLAAGAPGALLGGEERAAAVQQARRLLDAASGAGAAQRYRTAFAQGPAGARGQFTDMLHALTELLHERVRESVRRADERRALGATRAIEAVERAKSLAGGNVSPQLVTVRLLDELAEVLR